MPDLGVDLVKVPASPHFATVSLTNAFNARRAELPDALSTPVHHATAHGTQTIRGMPFAFGAPDAPDVLLLDSDPATIDVNGTRATYVLFVHAVEDIATNYLDGFADDQVDGYELGETVSDYVLEYEDGTRTSVPILRRFAIQQGRYGWGSAPFTCVPAADEEVFPSADEAQALGHPVVPTEEAQAARAAGMEPHEFVPWQYGFRSQTRTATGARRGLGPAEVGQLWIYALPNPEPERPLGRIVLQPREARSAIYAITTTQLKDHPLRPGLRRKLRVPLPEGATLNAAGELDDIGIDLGSVISARAALDYDHERWAGAEPAVEPARSTREVIVEYAAHPQALLYIGEHVVDLSNERPEGVTTVAPAHRPVTLRFRDGDSNNPVAVRLHLHGAEGEYLPPRGNHRKVNRTWSQDYAAELVNVENQYAYVDGECVADLPLGTVYVEITRGYEIAPVRTSIEVGPETDDHTFDLEKVLHWRERGWVTADTHVHFLSPQTALLEGKAEGVNVVSLLASQWGEMFSNVGDFDGGKTTFGAEDLDGHGEFLVRVGSENRMNVLGHISLLGYTGSLIQPLASGGPEESAVGDPLDATMAEWAQRARDQGGLVVMPHAPMPQLERAADVVLGVVDAIELMTHNPFHPDHGQLGAYGLADWYRYLNLGYHVPLVGGSDKMSAEMLLGGIRTYAQLGERELTYDNWMDAIRAGNTFATVGPLASIRVEGVEPGGVVRLPAGGGTVQVEWDVESVRMGIERVEVIAGGLVQEETTTGGALEASGHAAIPVTRSTWIALRTRGSYRDRPDDVSAHTSAVQVLVEGSELFSEHDSMTILDQIQGAIAYVDTIAPRPEMRRLRELRATLETAYNRLHQRMHAAGVYHRHPLHDPGKPHEH